MVKPNLILVLPIYNEEAQLAASIQKLDAYARQSLHPDYNWKIMVGDNGSTDRSPEIYQQLAQKNPRLDFRRIEQKGRGRMLKKIWLEVPFDIALYMDLDLSTDLPHIRRCVDAISQNGYDLAIGSRTKAGARVVGRSLKREITSRGYIYLVRLLAGSRLSDYQCGFKAISQAAARELVPHVQDLSWFFDTELLILAEKLRKRIHEEPVYWKDDPGSTVNITKTAIEDLKGLFRIRRQKRWRSLANLNQ